MEIAVDMRSVQREIHKSEEEHDSLVQGLNTFHERVQFTGTGACGEPRRDCADESNGLLRKINAVALVLSRILELRNGTT